jgi:hypothetical protein
MFLSVHIAEVNTGQAMASLRNKPEASAIEGCRYVETWMTAGFRKGTLPTLVITGSIMITAWDEDVHLERFLDHPTAKLYENGWRTKLEPARSIGQLPGLPELPRRERPTGDQPVAAITCGRVRANKFLPFIQAAGAAEREAASHPGFVEGLTLLRPPLIIGTFSLWRNATAMRQYTVGSYPGGHKEAMNKDKEQHFNHEMFFSRFVPYGSQGQWKGRNPLATLQSGDSGIPARERVGEAVGTVSRSGEPTDGYDV